MGRFASAVPASDAAVREYLVVISTVSELFKYYPSFTFYEQQNVSGLIAYFMCDTRIKK